METSQVRTLILDKGDSINLNTAQTFNQWMKS